MAEESKAEEVQRWTAKRRVALVVSLLKGEITVVEAARRYGLTVGEVETWRDRFLLGAENALLAKPRDDEALREEEVNRLRRKAGEPTKDLDIMRIAIVVPENAAYQVERFKSNCPWPSAAFMSARPNAPDRSVLMSPLRQLSQRPLPSVVTTTGFPSEDGAVVLHAVHERRNAVFDRKESRWYFTHYSTCTIGIMELCPLTMNDRQRS